MAGIYIHIPFCKKKCNYCNFFSVVSKRYKEEYLQALSKEIELQKKYLNGEIIETIYFGGGTPSILDSEEISNIINRLSKFFHFKDNVEITLEANPDDINNKKLKELKSTEINRLSIGVQSFFDDDLKYLGRIHNSEQAKNSIKRAQDAGFENLTIDFIYGIPTLSNKKWKENLQKTFELEIPHISAYSLTIEPNTPLEIFIRKGKSENINENKSVEQFKILMEQMKSNDFIHYEISNFCKSGYESKHNSNYWKMKKYLGLGPSAHSYDLDSRQWNISSIDKYIEFINNKKLHFEREILTEKQKFNEYVLTSLRTIDGCDLDLIKNKFGINYVNHCNSKAASFIKDRKLKVENNVMLLTNEGKLFADGISAKLFIDE